MPVISRGVTFVNTTPHPINLVWQDGEEFIVPPEGILINARPVEQEAGTHPAGVSLVRTTFVADPDEEKKLREIVLQYPKSVIIGSIVAAQAFPGRVLAMVPAPGFERVPPSEKKMRADKFVTY